jgi:hypothetical protein
VVDFMRKIVQHRFGVKKKLSVQSSRLVFLFRLTMSFATTSYAAAVLSSPSKKYQK